MGRLAELFEKKANGSLTEEEQKEYATLMAEAKAAQEGESEEEQNEDEQVDKLANDFAKKFMDKVGGNKEMSEKMDKLFDLIKEKEAKSPVEGKFIVDRKLGKKSVEELAEIKVAVPGRKEAGKAVTEVSMKTVHFAEAMCAGNVEKLQILSEGTAADGGYLVPEEFANMIVEDIRDQNVMRQIAAPAINVTTDTFHLPALASRPKAQWRSEKAVKNTSTVQFGEQVFTPYSLAVIVPLTNELVADASLGVNGSVVNYVSGLMATSLSEKEEEAFWVGNGSGKPTGVDGGAYSLRTVTVGSNQADSIMSAFMRTPQGYRNRGVFVANATTWERIGNLKDSQNNYLLTNLASSPTQTLRGRPIYEVNYLANGTLLYGDFGYYQIVDREGISIRVSDEATVAGYSAFERNLTFIRAEKRVDAELTLPAAITKVTGIV